MAAKVAELTTVDGGKGWVFFCPGCKYYHFFQTEKGPNYAGAPIWTWNGSVEKPTFSPSLGVNMGIPAARCHSFVRDGRIEYLGDSYHELRGQTVEMQETDWND